MTRRVEQRHHGDCMLCCIAMALGVDYEELIRKLGPAFVAMVNKVGIMDEAEPPLFETLGLKLDMDFRKIILSPHWCSIQFAKNILWGRRALITVRSKNNQDGWHSVYWDGTSLYDPSTKKQYESIQEVEPIELYIFQERTL